MSQVSHLVLAVSLIVSLAITVPGHSAKSPPASERGAQLRIVGPGGEDPPVVNERGKIRLRVIDDSDTGVAVTRYSTGSPEIARITKKGVLKGKLYGFATITAETALGEAATTVVVARVRRSHGSRGDGDTKTDSAGNLYLTLPAEHVIFESDGIRDKVFAGARGGSGYRNGSGADARFNYPTGLGVDLSANGGLYVADTGNHCVRKVKFDGRTELAIGSPGNTGQIEADVVGASEAAFDGPSGLAASGPAFYVADTNNHALYYVDGLRSTVSLLAGQPGVEGYRNGLFREATFDRPSGLALNTSGDLMAVADTGNDAVRLVRIEAGGAPYRGRVSTAGVSSSGRGTPATGFAFSAPTSVSFDGAENICVVDSAGASVVTRAADGRQAKVLLAQEGSLGRPASVVVSGTRTVVTDASASSPSVAIVVVEVGAPVITSVTPSRLPEGLAGTEIVIDGANFPPEARVVVDGKLITNVRVDSATRIVAVLPAQARGGRLVSVVTRGGVAQREFDIVPPTLEDLEPGEITTYAGTASPSLGDGGPAVDAAVDIDFSYADILDGYGNVSVDGFGNVYVVSPGKNRIRRIDAQTGVISTIVGTGRAEPGQDGQLAVAFGLARPLDGVVGPDGGLYVADTGFHRVVRVDPITSEVSIVLGTATTAGAGPDGAAAGPGFLLNSPQALAFDGGGNLFVSDVGNLRVLRVDAATGLIAVVAGGGPVGGVPEDGEVATSTSYTVASLDVDGSGLLALGILSGGSSLGRIATVNGNGLVDVVADYARDVAFDGDGRLVYSLVREIVRQNLATGATEVVAGGGDQWEIGEGGPATRAWLEIAPVAVDATGNLFIADVFNGRIRRVDGKSGIITTLAGGQGPGLAGDGGLATSASMDEVLDIAWVEGRGLCILGSFVFGVRVVDEWSAILTTPIGNGPRTQEIVPEEGDPASGAPVVPVAVESDAADQILFSHAPLGRGNPNTLWRVGPSGTLERVAGPGTGTVDGIPALDAYLARVADILRAPNGDVYLLDAQSRLVRKIDRATGTIRTVAGRVYSGVSEYTGEGGPAVAATLASPNSIALAPNGDLYIADTARILRVDSSGIIRTVSGGADFGVPVGGTIGAARYERSLKLLHVGASTLFVSDAFNHVVVRLDFANDAVVPVAGLPGVGTTEGDGGPATEATIVGPGALAADRNGNLYIASVSPSSIGLVRVIKGAAHAGSTLPF